MNLPSVRFPMIGEGDPLYGEVMRIWKILTASCKDSIEVLLEQLPLVGWADGVEEKDLVFCLCCHFQNHVFRFFYDMVTSFLSYTEFMVHIQYATDFYVKGREQRYLLGEVVIRCLTLDERRVLVDHFMSARSEMILGIESSHHARSMIERRGLASDHKMALLHALLMRVIKQRPQYFDYDLFSDMQHLLMQMRSEFKLMRSYQHLSRIVCVQYLFKKALLVSNETQAHTRQISMRLLKGRLLPEYHALPIVGVFIGMILEEDEVLEEEHVYRAVRVVAPHVCIVAGSFLAYLQSSPKMILLYFELEKHSVSSLNEFKSAFMSELRHHIEKKTHAVLMPYNEEEWMRHIITLSYQVRYVRDLPQVIILYQDQSRHHLEFMVVVVYVFNLKDAPLSLAFQGRDTESTWFIEKTCTVGKIRNKYLKKALVCRVQVEKHPFLRKDQSIDLYKARHHIAFSLEKRIGEFRDYYGGMIAKESETLDQLQAEIEVSDQSSFLLENFFYHLSPMVAKTIYPSKILQTFFLHMLEAGEQGLAPGQRYCSHMFDAAEGIYLCIVAVNLTFHDRIQQKLKYLPDIELEVMTSFFTFTEVPVLGIFCSSKALPMWKIILFAIEHILEEWEGNVLSPI